MVELETTRPQAPHGTGCHAMCVRPGQEGLAMRDGDPRSLAEQLRLLAGDAPLRARLGRSARERVVARFSWARHCEQLEQVLVGMAA